jgi:hypothetical protein
MANPTPIGLQNAIIADINWMAGPYRSDSVKKSDKLDIKFRLTKYARKALAGPFEQSARAYGPAGTVISRAVCGELKTVGAAVTLVSKAAGFDGSWNDGGAE